MTTQTRVTAPTTAPRPRRERVRLTLAMMMILVLAVGGVLGWFAYSARVQRNAVAAIRKAGGAAYYNGQTSAPGTPPPSKWQFLRWLRRSVGDDYFDTVTFVGFNRGLVGLDDRLMAQIGRLTGIEWMNIQGRKLPAGLTPRGTSQLRRLTRLRTLVVQGPPDTTVFLAGIGHPRQLQRLWLASATATDDDVATLGELTELESLELNGSGISDAGFSRLSNLRRMKQLTLDDCVVSDFSAVRSMRDLERLRLGSRSLVLKKSERNRPVSLEPFRDMKKLTMLTIGDVPIDDQSLHVLASLPALNIFAASGRGITENGLPLLAAAPRLFSMVVTDTSIQDLRPLGARAAQLGWLDLGGSPVTNDGLSPLAGANRIVRLGLSQTKITDAGLPHLSAMSQLSTLGLEDTEITDAGLAHLSGLTALTILDLKGTRVTGAGLAGLARAKRLQHVDLSNTAITDGGLAEVAKLRSLKRIDLGGTQISDLGLASLKPLRGLEYLALSGTRISDAGIAQLVVFPRLRHLTIHTTNITDAGLASLAKVRTLRSIDAHGTRISDDGIARLKAALPNLEFVTLPVARRQ
jgi:internalin A